MKKGVLAGFASYFLWGLFPIFFHALKAVDSFQVLAHRIVWSFFFLVLLLSLRRDWAVFRRSLNLRVVLLYFGVAVLLTVNWGVYVWAIANGHVVEASLGYFINPLVNVLLGVVFLKERLRPLQWVPVGLAAAGVLYLTISYGAPPWIALALAFSFGLYGMMKKIAPLGSLHSLTLETGTVFLPALAFLLVAEFSGRGAFGHVSGFETLLLSLTGVVTSIPLLLFTYGARRIPYSTMGLLQYVAPTLQFLSGVILFSEPFSHHQAIGFGIIWAALILFTIETYLHNKRPLPSPEELLTPVD
jgi:chloramphenicol-sensitive protein RarD